MAFTWTYPDPLDPNKPSLIGKHLRFEIGSFAIYFRELQDAVNTLRENIGQVAYSWPSEVPIGETLEHDHYTILITAINQLLIDYDYTSVIDILGRDWTELKWVTNIYPSVEKKLQRLGGWQLIQDFRDVLDVLSGLMERWRTVETPIDYIEEISGLIKDYGLPIRYYSYIRHKYDFTGDLGQWISDSWTYPSFKYYGYHYWDNYLFLLYESYSYSEVYDEKLHQHTETISYIPPIGTCQASVSQVLLSCNLDSEITIQENDKFTFKINALNYTGTGINFPYVQVSITLYDNQEYHSIKILNRLTRKTELLDIGYEETFYGHQYYNYFESKTFEIDLTPWKDTYPKLKRIEIIAQAYSPCGSEFLSKIDYEIDDIGISRMAG